MTNELLKAWLECLKRDLRCECCVNDECEHCDLLKKQGTLKERIDALDKVIKALEEEPYRKSEKVVAEVKLDKKFIDEAVHEAVKDIKQNYIPKDVLDKIRAEIVELRSRQNVGVLECLDIIDKHRTESEE